MPRKYLKSYKEMSSKSGCMDPLQYLFNRYEWARKQKLHDKAEEMAWRLAPYGHGKATPKDADGNDVQTVVITLE